METDTGVEDYLERVELLGWILPQRQLHALLADLRARVAVAAADGDRDGARVLAELGTPGEVVRAAQDRRWRAHDHDPMQLRPPVARPEVTTVGEWLTVALLVAVGVLVFVSPWTVLLYGTAAVSAAGACRWRGAEIGMAILLPVPVGIPGVLWLLSLAPGTCRELLPALTVCSGALQDSSPLLLGTVGVAFGALAAAGAVMLVRVGRGRAVRD